MKKTNKILALVMAVAMIFGMMSVLPVVGSADDEWFTGSYVGLAMSNGNVYVSDGFVQWAYGGDPAVSYNPYVVYGDAVTANAIKVTVDTMPSSNLTENATVYVDLDQWANGQFVPWSLNNAAAVAATLEIDGNTLIYKFAAEATGKTFCVVWGDGASEDDGGQITFSTDNVKAGLLDTSVAGLTVPTTINGSDVDNYSEIELSSVSWKKKTDSGTELESGIEDGKIVISAIKGFNEGTATLPSACDVTGYSGVLLHMDFSQPEWNVNSDPAYTKCYVGVRLYLSDITGYAWTRDTNKLADGSYLNYDIDAYYSTDGSDWSKTSLVYDSSHKLDESTGNGERFMVPAGFVGWLYIPFTSYNTTKVDNDVNKYPTLGLYNNNITKFMILTGGSKNDASKDMIVDSFGFVKLETPAASVSELRLSYADADADDKIDAFYLNAVVKADVTDTVGIIFSDSADSCAFGAAPLFSRACTKYDALMQSACYGQTVITAANLGGEEGDKLISVHWLDLPTDNLANGSTLYARTFIKSADGTVTYQDVVSFTLVEGTSSNSIV